MVYTVRKVVVFREKDVVVEGIKSYEYVRVGVDERIR